MESANPDDRPTPTKKIVLAMVVGLVVGNVGLARAESPIEDYDKLRIAEHLVSEGDTAGALAAVESIETTTTTCRGVGRLLFERTTLLAAQLLEKDHPARSAELLLLLPPSGSRYLDAVQRFRRAKDEPAARRAEGLLLVDGAASQNSRRLAEALGPEGVAARLGSVEREMDRIRVLLATHRNEDALNEATALSQRVGKKHALACELGYTKGKASRKLRRYGPAIRALTAARQICHAAKNETFAPRCALLEVQVRGIRGQARGTKAVATWLEKHYPNHTFRDDAWMIVAEAEARNGQPEEARATYRRIIGLRGADHASLAAWRVAFEDILAGKNDEAVGQLDQILAGDVPRASEHHRALYWRAKLEPDANRRRALYAKLTVRPSFYTWMAIDRARQDDPPLAKYLENILLEIRSHAAAPPKATILAERADTKHWYQRARALMEHDEPELAADELARIECLDLTDDVAYALARAYHDIGAYPRAQWVVRTRRDLLSKLTAKTHPVWTTAYSRAYEEQIGDAATKAKLEKWFLLGLVREESTFDPNIVSWAGAVGLAQLMPPTAIGAYAETHRGRRLKLHRLTEPALNLRLGGHVLAQGLRRFGSEPLALSAYNGGPGLTNRMLPEKETQFDRWVETLPVRETRRYVKRVTETWGLYRYLYDAKDPFVSLPRTVKKR